MLDFPINLVSEFFGKNWMEIGKKCAQSVQIWCKKCQ